MNREELYKEIKETLGLVPGFFKTIPDSALELEWNLFKLMQLADGPIPSKYRHLIGIGISAATKCRYCSLFHTEVAKLHGATDEEIEDAVLFAKSTTGWSSYVNGMQVDYDEFKDELRRIGEYVQSKHKA